MYNQKQKSNVHLRKKHKTADRKGGGGGGSTLTVSLTVKYPFFFLTASLREEVKYHFADFVYPTDKIRKVVFDLLPKVHLYF